MGNLLDVRSEEHDTRNLHYSFIRTDGVKLLID